MALIVCIANQKGGSGKTTTAQQLAAELESAKYRIVVVDMDPQASFSKWCRQRDKLSVPKVSMQDIKLGFLEDDLLALKERADLDIVLVDCPGNIEEITQRVLKLSDAVICPVRATAIDIDATKSMARIVGDIRNGNGELRFIVFHNAKHSTRRQDREAFDNLVRIFKPGKKTFVLQTAIADTAAVAEAGMTGKAVSEYAPKSPSAKSYRKLTKEVLQCLAAAQA